MTAESLPTADTAADVPAAGRDGGGGGAHGGPGGPHSRLLFSSSRGQQECCGQAPRDPDVAPQLAVAHDDMVVGVVEGDAEPRVRAVHARGETMQTWLLLDATAAGPAHSPTRTRTACWAGRIGDGGDNNTLRGRCPIRKRSKRGATRGGSFRPTAATPRR